MQISFNYSCAESQNQNTIIQKRSEIKQKRFVLTESKERH